MLRGHLQFPMDLMNIAMEPQSVNVRVGGFNLANLFAGEIGWEPALPELVFAFDLPFGLGRRGIKEADVVELESPAQLSHRVGILGEENGVVIDVDLQRSSIEEKGRGQEIQVGQEQFSIVEFGTHEQSAAVVEHVEHGKVQGGGGKPTMGGSVQLPEFSNPRALPAAHWGVRTFGRHGMGQAVFPGPMSHLSPIQLEAVQAQGFRGREAVRARRGASQTFSEQIGDRLGPLRGVVATRSSGDPELALLGRVGAQVIGRERIKAAAREPELFGRLAGAQRLLSEAIQHMADE